MLYPSTASRDPINTPVDDSEVDPNIGMDTSGVVLFSGDDAGSVQRWEITGQSLAACGLLPVRPLLREDSFKERRLPTKRVKVSQVSPCRELCPAH